MEPIIMSCHVCEQLLSHQGRRVEGKRRTSIVLSTYLFDVAANFETQGRVKTARRLIKKENTGICHESICDAGLFF
jgi:hypothetical protein